MMYPKSLEMHCSIKVTVEIMRLENWFFRIFNYNQFYDDEFGIKESIKFLHIQSYL